MKREKFNPSPEYRKFISSLRLARQEKNVSQRELARRLKWHWTRLIRSENCERSLDIIEVRAICQALEISVVEFTRQLEAVLSAVDVATDRDENASSGEDTDVSSDVTVTTGTE